MGLGWVMGLEGKSDNKEGVTNGEVLAFGGVQFPILRPAGAAALENVMAVTGDDEIDVIG